MLIGSPKSPPPYSSDSSCASALRAITRQEHISLVLDAFLTSVGLPSNACSTLSASLALVSKYGRFPLDWQNVMARFDDIILLFSSTSILLPITTCDVRQHSTPGPAYSGYTHKWKALRVSGASLDKELVSPAVEGFETLGVVDVVY